MGANHWVEGYIYSDGHSAQDLFLILFMSTDWLSESHRGAAE